MRNVFREQGNFRSYPKIKEISSYYTRSYYDSFKVFAFKEFSARSFENKNLTELKSKIIQLISSLEILSKNYITRLSLLKPKKCTTMCLLEENVDTKGNWKKTKHGQFIPNLKQL